MDTNTHMLGQKTESKLWWLLFSAWTLAVAATLGSLFFSEIMEYAPCTLCWYQRIFIYPLVFILGSALFPVDRSAIKYSLILTIIGWAIAAYHSLLYYKIIPERMAPCSQGVSCTQVYFEWWGFMSIPLLSFLNFTLILFLLGVAHQSQKGRQS
jgi:disulfide bond formation protein DsbB